MAMHLNLHLNLHLLRQVRRRPGQGAIGPKALAGPTVQAPACHRGQIWACLWLAASMVCGLAAAQSPGTVYRCGPGQYSQQPCPGGTPLATDPAPDAARQRAAEDQARRDAARADKLRQERLARERAASGQAAARIGPVPAQGPAAAAQRAEAPRPKKGKHRQADLHGARVAQGPGTRPAQPRQAKATPSAGQASPGAGTR